MSCLRCLRPLAPVHSVCQAPPAPRGGPSPLGTSSVRQSGGFDSLEPAGAVAWLTTHSPREGTRSHSGRTPAPAHLAPHVRARVQRAPRPIGPSPARPQTGNFEPAIHAHPRPSASVPDAEHAVGWARNVRAPSPHQPAVACPVQPDLLRRHSLPWASLRAPAGWFRKGGGVAKGCCYAAGRPITRR